MKKTGIWIDKNEAFIVSLEGSKESTVIVPSNIEHFNVRGGSGTRLKGGPQDVVQDSKYLEREKHQFRNYFNEVVSHISDADAIAIFGPAGTNDRLKKELEQSYKEVNQKVVAVIKADSMTENQIRALVRDYFDPNVE